MNASEPQNGGSALAQAANALVAAEAALADADSRLKQAERERRAAIEEINKLQKQMNNAIAELQQRTGPIVSRPREREKDTPLILQPEDVVQDESTRIRPQLASVGAEFDRLKAVSESARGQPEGVGVRRGTVK